MACEEMDTGSNDEYGAAAAMILEHVDRTDEDVDDQQLLDMEIEADLANIIEEEERAARE